MKLAKSELNIILLTVVHVLLEGIDFESVWFHNWFDYIISHEHLRQKAIWFADCKWHIPCAASAFRCWSASAEDGKSGWSHGRTVMKLQWSFGEISFAFSLPRFHRAIAQDGTKVDDQYTNISSYRSCLVSMYIPVMAHLGWDALAQKCWSQVIKMFDLRLEIINPFIPCAQPIHKSRTSWR